MTILTIDLDAMPDVNWRRAVRFYVGDPGLSLAGIVGSQAHVYMPDSNGVVTTADLPEGPAQVRIDGHSYNFEIPAPNPDASPTQLAPLIGVAVDYPAPIVEQTQEYAISAAASAQAAAAAAAGAEVSDTVGGEIATQVPPAVSAEVAAQVPPAVGAAIASVNPVPVPGATPGKIAISFGEGNTTDEFNPLPASYEDLVGRPAQLDSLVDGPVLGAGPLVVLNEANFHNGFPHMIRRGDGMLIAVWRRGPAHGNGYGQIRRSFSDDNGTTWRNAAGQTSTTVLESMSDQVQKHNGMDSRDPNLTELPDGRIVMTFYMRNPSGEWDNSTRAAIKISSDGGLTFGTTIQMPTVFTNFVGCSSVLCVLPDGTVIFPIFGSSTMTPDGSTTPGIVVTYLYSTLATLHDAAGWASAATPIYDGVTHMASECSIIPHSDGTKLIAAVRFDSGNTTRIFHKPISGGTWTEVGIVNLMRSSPKMLRTASGRILMPYRTAGPDLYCALAWSDDDGITWGGNAPPMYLTDPPTRTFVYSGVVEARPGVCLIFYGVEDEVTHYASLHKRTVAVHPVHAPGLLEIPQSPWANPVTVIPAPTGLAVYYNPARDARAPGDTLVRLSDRSGFERHGVPSATVAPVYELDEEGRLCLKFGAGNYVDIPKVLGDSLWRTLVLAVERIETPTPGGNVQMLVTNQSATNVNDGWSLTHRGTDQVIRHMNGTTGSTTHINSTNLAPYLENPMVIVASQDPAQIMVGVNGVISSAPPATPPFVYTPTAATVTRIGESISGSVTSFQGRLYGFAAFELSMTGDALKQAAAWLAQECGISGTGW